MQCWKLLCLALRISRTAQDVRDARQFRRSKTAAEGRASAAAAAQMEYKRTRTTTE